MKIGINGSGQLAHPNLDAIVTDIENSEADGFASYWLAQTALADSLAMLAIAGRTTSTIELGTAVVPTWTRHPEVMAAGGFLMQLMPNAGDTTAERLTDRLSSLPPSTTMLRQGLSPTAIAERLLEGFPYRALSRTALRFACHCSRQQILTLLQTLGAEELTRLIAEDGEASVTCEYCKELYHVKQETLQAIRASL